MPPFFSTELTDSIGTSRALARENLPTRERDLFFYFFSVHRTTIDPLVPPRLLVPLKLQTWRKLSRASIKSRVRNLRISRDKRLSGSSFVALIEIKRVSLGNKIDSMLVALRLRFRKAGGE